jgi:AraC-like DNA-binding protein
MTTLPYSVLAESRGVRDTLRALGTLAGMAVKLAPVHPQPDGPVVATRTIPLCRLILSNPKGACACRRFLARLQSQCKCGVQSTEWGISPRSCSSPEAKPRPVRALRTPQSAVCAQECFAGLTELAAPITKQGTPVATLVCGEFFPTKPTNQGFERCLRRLRALGIRLDRRRARGAYFQTPVARLARIRAARRLLADLAQHLGEMETRCLLARRTTDPHCVACAKNLVTKHPDEMPSTRSAARASHVTEPYFCRRFKAATGMTFTEYVARCHVEQARELLRDPGLRVTDVAYAAGFQSIPHFNRTFKRYTGVSPKGYRVSLAAKTS